ncbi:2-phospho-L-lactate guanylyltransferase [Isoptericola sp. CG 20/1183]|uniref:Phosphoenolpyruvate guanylyltransferase n=1 Tax=Isoptericola halotolerans TaxID=300560 RepID=A0ABX5EID9_9MICO|nr:MULTISPECIES: 2-phospho-L-lactate guanylyltransferase [Isoptericola]PRZ08215.1 2-phospho-L-lactate guanylyltransferase [Isoptericola halotolerans]PRZ09012.1 2-phospho-L-lactate guanylyltransferase [Isoptericola sp. CG 20/1183]
MTSPRTVAVVPLRDGVSGKSRLAAALDPGARRRLVVALARHVGEVLASLVADGGLAGVVVVTADVPFVEEVLPGLIGNSSPDRQSGLPIRSRVAEVIPEPPDRPGLNGALDHAREHVRVHAREHGAYRGADRVLVVHADLPRLTAADVHALLTTEADVAVATDRHGTGTNLLSVPLEVPGADGFPFRFGPGSRAAHEGEAAAHGLTSAVVQRPGTAADLDTIDDWAELPGEIRARVGAAVGHPLTAR